MVKAKFSVSAIFSLVISFVLLAGFCVIVYGCVPAAFGSGFIFGRIAASRSGAIACGLSSAFFAVVQIYILRRFVFFITINMERKTITFRNILATKSRTYQFAHFAGFFDTYSVSKSGAYKNLYLINQSKAEKIISGFYFENMDELQTALSGIPYLGKQENSGKISRRALMNMSVLDV